MNRYNSAMENITVTPEAKQRILSRLAMAPAARPVAPKARYIAGAALLAAAGFAIAIGIKAFIPSQPSVQPPPLTAAGAAELGDLPASFPLYLPTLLPAGFSVESAGLLSDEAVQITYASGEARVLYRMGTSAGAVDEIPEEYAHTEEFAFGSITGVLQGEAENSAFALWTDGALYFSLHARPPLPHDEMMGMIKSVEPLFEQEP